ncbi:MAG: hypothetical protein V4714_16450 [Bacteroidota bacterium]
MKPTIRIGVAILAGNFLLLLFSSFFPVQQPSDPLLHYTRCLVPIQVQLKSGQHNFGTGFLLRKQTPEDTIVYLVTARHVLWDYSANQPAVSMSLVLMEKERQASWKQYPLASDSLPQHLFLHPDSTVDAALVRLDISPKAYANQFLDASEILGMEAFKRVFQIANAHTDFSFYVGYHMDSLMQNNLFTQVGRGPIPQFPSALQRPQARNAVLPSDNYLISQMVLAKGNSGSPVFILINQERFRSPKGRPLVVLAGIVSAVIPNKTIRQGKMHSDAEEYTLKPTRLVAASKLAEIIPH